MDGTRLREASKRCNLRKMSVASEARIEWDGRVSLTSYSSAAMWCSGTVKSRVGGTVGESISWTRVGGAGGVACSSPLYCSPRALTMVTFINESAPLAQSPELARGGVMIKSTILRAMTLFFYVFKK